MLRQFFAIIAGAALLVLGLMFSVALFAFIAVAGLFAWGYFWWKTRALRKVMSQRTSSAGSSSGDIFEGEVILVEEQQGSTIELLPTKTKPPQIM
jgi:UPF0716 family protein affecting phage T7 exclusion